MMIGTVERLRDAHCRLIRLDGDVHGRHDCITGIVRRHDFITWILSRNVRIIRLVVGH